jgi:hypothetical protein
MKALLLVMAVLESGTGAALLVAPSDVAFALVGAPLETSAGLLVANVAGAALLALGVACSLMPVGRTAAALILPMLAYNVGVAALLVHARLVLELSGIGLWPAVVLHAALAVWCVACLTRLRWRSSPAAPSSRAAGTPASGRALN